MRGKVEEGRGEKKGVKCSSMMELFTCNESIASLEFERDVCRRIMEILSIEIFETIW